MALTVESAIESSSAISAAVMRTRLRATIACTRLAGVRWGSALVLKSGRRGPAHPPRASGRATWQPCARSHPRTRPPARVTSLPPPPGGRSGSGYAGRSWRYRGASSVRLLGLGGLAAPSLQGGPDEQRAQELQLAEAPCGALWWKRCADTPLLIR